MLEKISKLCSERGITITALERELNFGNSTIAKWREVSPSVSKLKKVADYFGVSVDYFLNDTTDAVQ